MWRSLGIKKFLLVSSFCSGTMLHYFIEPFRRQLFSFHRRTLLAFFIRNILPKHQPLEYVRWKKLGRPVCYVPQCFSALKKTRMEFRMRRLRLQSTNWYFLWLFKVQASSIKYQLIQVKQTVWCIKRKTVVDYQFEFNHIYSMASMIRNNHLKKLISGLFGTSSIPKCIQKNRQQMILPKKNRDKHSFHWITW